MSFTKIPITGLSDNVVTQIQSGGGIPKITSIDYPGDDTAANPAGGQTITINGANFSNSSVVYIDGSQVSVVSFIDANTLSFVAPAKAASSYALYVVNSDGATAISVPGVIFSNSPVWSTSSGSLGSPYEAASFSASLSATGDGSVTYAVSSGNSLPSGLTLGSNGYLSGTIPATDPTTTYTFYVDAIDSQNQETSRSFSVTYNKDAVTWASPANGAAYTWGEGQSNTQTLEANSAAGKSISYSVQSGSLPANVSISGANVVGTPTTVAGNTSVVIRALAADTLRYADRTLYFTIIAGNPNRGIIAGGSDGGSNIYNTIDYITIASTGNATDFGDMRVNLTYSAGCASSTRGLFAGGSDGVSQRSAVDYLTIASLGNSTFFGDLQANSSYGAGISNQTRAIISLGNITTGHTDFINYFTIATTGNYTSFGSVRVRSYNQASFGSSTRGLLAAGTSYSGQTEYSGSQSFIDYLTIATTGSVTNFGNLQTRRSDPGGGSSSTRGLIVGGNQYTSIEYVTIASLGSGTNFGDLTMGASTPLVLTSETIAVVTLGWSSPYPNNRMEKVTIASTGNATYFGDLTQARGFSGGCSSVHGGLQ